MSVVIEMCDKCGERPIHVKKRRLCVRCYQKAMCYSPSDEDRARVRALRNQLKDARLKAVNEAREAKRKAKLEAMTAVQTIAEMAASESRRAIEDQAEQAKRFSLQIAQGKTLQEIGGAEGLSRERVRQILKRHGVSVRDIKPKPVGGLKLALSKRMKSMFRVLVMMDTLVDRSGGKDACWLWTGGSFNPHGCRSDYRLPKLVAYDPLDSEKPRSTTAYRVMYMLFKGPIPKGMTVDHICFNPMCCNPAHLQLLTNSENSARKNPERLKRQYGHPRTHCRKCQSELTVTQTGFRYCRQCDAERGRRYRERKAREEV